MAISYDGKVGIGTTSPVNFVDIIRPDGGDAALGIKASSAGDPTIHFDSALANRSAVITFKDQGTISGFIRYHHNGDRMQFGSASSSTVSMTIKGEMVGIGTPDPTTSKLQIHHNKGSAGQAWTAIGPGNMASTVLVNESGTNNTMAGYLLGTYTGGGTTVNVRGGMVMNFTDSGNHSKLHLSATDASANTRNVLSIDGSNKYVGINEETPVRALTIAGGSDPSAEAMIHMDADTAGGECGLSFKADSTNDDRRIKASIRFRRDDPGTRGTGNLHFCMNGDNNDVNASTAHSRFAILSDNDITMKCAANTPSASVVGWRYNNANTSNPWVKSAVNSTSGATHYQFYNSNGAVGQIYTSGSATTFATSSDYRLKENVDYSWDATTLLKQLKPCKFNFKKEEGSSKPTLQGFLAHEVSNIVPGAVRYEKDAVDSDGDPEYQALDNSKLVPLLVKTIQELEARITTLEG